MINLKVVSPQKVIFEKEVEKHFFEKDELKIILSYYMFNRFRLRYLYFQKTTNAQYRLYHVR